MNDQQLGVLVWAVVVLGPAVFREIQLQQIKRRLQENGSDTCNND